MKILKWTGIKKLSKIILKWNTISDKKLKPMEKKPIPEKDRKKIKDYYKEDIKELERIIDRDLSFWK